MWHLFGPIIRWPLHSPQRLLAVVVGVIAAVLLLGEINDRGAPAGTTADGVPGTATSAPTPEPDATPSSGASVPPDATTAPGAAAGGTDAFSDDPAAQDAMAAAAQAAAEFVAAWARPDLDAEAWRAGLAPLTAPRLLESLADTDPANVPAVTVSGQPVRVAANAEAAVLDVPTTGMFVRVSVQLVDGAWLATDVQPAA